MSSTHSSTHSSDFETTDREDAELLGSHRDKSTKKLSPMRIVALSSACSGWQAAFSVEFSFVSPLLALLHVSPLLVTLIWLAGPLSGFLVQPIIGSISDRSERKWGRRRPYIFGGFIFTFVGLGLLAFSVQIAKLIMGKNYRVLAIIIVCIALWILNLSINTMMTPSRTLVDDFTKPTQQDILGQSTVTLMLGLSNFLANLAGSVDLVHYLPGFKSNTLAIFTFGMIILVISTLPTLFFAKETQFKRPPNSKRYSALGLLKMMFVKIVKKIRTMPRKMLILCMVYFFSWLAYFPFQIYMTDYMGKVVYKGDPTASKHSEAYENYQIGVRKGALTFALMSIVSCFFSLIIDKMSKVLGIRLTYFLSQLLAGICMVLTLWVQTPTASMIMFSLIGYNFTTFNSMPFSLIGDYVDGNDQESKKEDTGLLMGVLNSFGVLAQVISNFVAGSFILKSYPNKDHYAIAYGGFTSIVPCILVWFLNERKPKTKVARISEGIQEENNVVEYIN
ncbi:hypothetical protein M0813_29590 [Anaeramoeba flamelloides]|uniref:Sucrose transporter n=1 Tax=Anaeramoeba flamelloides TaxID=1746091 RepID=A0AAV7ZET2_9EUKA|nr:hypothetical protein M0812_17460 [Anaeramoeba flamelloides]KAJ6233913.1 hypothetical protein M0813_29590 [Anaeramoeba flamelloides]